MFSNIAASDLIGDALIAKGVQKPIEYLGCVTNSDGLKDTGLQHISAVIIKKRQRAGQAANPSDQINRATIIFGGLKRQPGAI